MYRCKLALLRILFSNAVVKVEVYGKEGIVAVTHVYVLDIQVAHERLFVGEKVGS